MKQQITLDQLFYRPAEVAYLLRCSVPTIYAMLNAGTLGSTKNGRVRLINGDDVRAKLLPRSVCAPTPDLRNTADRAPRP
jgi:excisionase family DNA binding protein